MSRGRIATPIGMLFERGSFAGLDDARLLERYARGGDRDAFEALAARHGPMVLGVCRRILEEPSDVDDAFQATFLVLIRRAGSLGPRDVLAAWLHGVATRVARRARMDRARRRARERDGLTVEPGREPDAPDFALREAVDEEVERLPWKYRAPVALCYLEGLTHEQAAARLGWPLGTVKGRLARARSLLGSRLSRRGVTAGASAVALDGLASAAVPDALASAVATAAGKVAEGIAWGSVSSCSVVKLVKGARGAMIVTKSAVAGLAGAALIAAAGVGIAAARSGGPGPSEAAPSIVESNPRDEDAPRDSSPKTAAILKKLDAPLTMSFPNETPLEDILKYIKQATQGPNDFGIPIYVDPKGLSEVDKVVGSVVSIDLEGVPLRRSLQLVLEQLDLVYYVEDGFLTVTSEERALFGLPPETIRSPVAFREEIAKAARGDMAVEEMEKLARKLKLIDEIRAAVSTPRPTGKRGGFQ